jgi:DNA-binding GntR family transcriptional regulator
VEAEELEVIGRIERPVPLAQQAYDSIRHELLSGRWSPEERLTEEQVARRLSISRTPAREALQRLVLMGSLDSVPGGGYAQRTLNARAVREHCELRLLLEPEAAALACARDRPELATLLETKDLRRPALDPARDMRFHVAIAEVSGNEVLAGLVRTLNERAAIHRLYGHGLDTRLRDRLEDGHAQVVVALEARDPAAAFSAMSDHLRLEQDLMLLEPLES